MKVRIILEQSIIQEVGKHIDKAIISRKEVVYKNIRRVRPIYFGRQICGLSVIKHGDESCFFHDIYFESKEKVINFEIEEE